MTATASEQVVRETLRLHSYIDLDVRCKCGYQLDQSEEFSTIKDQHDTHQAAEVVAALGLWEKTVHVVHVVEGLLDDCDQLADAPQRPNRVAVWGVRKALEPFGGTPHRWQIDQEPSSPRKSSNADLLGKIAQAHQKGVDGHGGTWGECVECGHYWPCPTYEWTTGRRDALLDPWYPMDDEVPDGGE